MKSTIDCRLSDVLLPTDSYILSHWNNARGMLYESWGLFPRFGVKNEYQQWHIIAAPSHPILESVIAAVRRNIERYDVLKYGVGRFGVLKTTGPIAYSLAVQNALPRSDCRLVNVEELGLRYSIFDDETHKFIHKQLLGKHYSRHREPIVMSSDPARPNRVVSKSKIFLSTARDRIMEKLR